MSDYEKKIVDGKVIWVPKTQEAIAVPQNKPKPKVDLPKRTGRQYGERKNWW